MAKKTKSISTYNDIPVKSKLQFVGLIDPKEGGFRFKRGQRSKTWHFGCQLVAWQANGGPVVREKIFVRKERLDDSQAMRLIRQTTKGRVIQFLGSRPSSAASIQKDLAFVKLEGSICKPENTLAISNAAKARAASLAAEIKDRVFGVLKFDKQSDSFTTDASFRGTTMGVSFETESVDELKELIEHAKPLWRKRQSWFSAWRENVFKYYMANMADEWWLEDYSLTKKKFNQLLAWPVGVQFHFDEEKFRYVLTGWSEELFTDHGIDAGGSTISDMEVVF